MGPTINKLCEITTVIILLIIDVVNLGRVARNAAYAGNATLTTSAMSKRAAGAAYWRHLANWNAKISMQHLFLHSNSCNVLDFDNIRTPPVSFNSAPLCRFVTHTLPYFRELLLNR